MNGGLKSYTFVWHTRPQFLKKGVRQSPSRFSSFLCCRIYWNEGLHLHRDIHNNQPNYHRHNRVFEPLKMSQQKLKLTLLWDFFIFMAVLKAVQDWDPQRQHYGLTIHLSFCPTTIWTENEPSMVSRGGDSKGCRIQADAMVSTHPGGAPQRGEATIGPQLRGYTIYFLRPKYDTRFLTLRREWSLASFALLRRTGGWY